MAILLRQRQLHAILARQRGPCRQVHASASPAELHHAAGTTVCSAAKVASLTNKEIHIAEPALMSGQAARAVEQMSKSAEQAADEEVEHPPAGAAPPALALPKHARTRLA